MTKTVKNIIMVFTLLAAIFLIVFCIELILVNRSTENGEDPATIEGSAQEENGEEEYGYDDQEFPNGEEGYDNGEFDETFGMTDDVGFPMPMAGRRFEMPMDGTDLTLVAYADEDFFEYVAGDYSWYFVYTQGGSATLEISFELIPPEGMSVLAGRLLIGFLEGGESRVTGEEYIGNSLLRGHGARGEGEDGVTFEAWAHELSERLALRITVSFENEVQRAALHTILDSMTIEDIEI